MSRDTEDRLRDILECIRKARNADALLQTGDEAGDRELMETAFAAVERNLFVIGEAAKDLPDELLALAPEVNWKAIKGLRDVLGHEYFRIVPKIVHATVRENLDPLETAVIKTPPPGLTPAGLPAGRTDLRRGLAVSRVPSVAPSATPEGLDRSSCDHGTGH